MDLRKGCSKFLDMLREETRPPINVVSSATEFERWYWSVNQLKAKCEQLDLPKVGTKSEMRSRVASALANPDKPLPETAKPKRTQKSFWSKAPLTVDTVITNDISFGPNLRSFMKTQIGKSFVCHSDFMDWCKSNEGATLGDAVEAWQILENRKLDSSFRREIAQCNNYLRYLRDMRDNHPDLSIHDAITCWDQKKIRPAVDGFVIYEQSDLKYLDASAGSA